MKAVSTFPLRSLHHQFPLILLLQQTLMAVFIAIRVSAGYILKKERLVDFSVPSFSDIVHKGSAQVLSPGFQPHQATAA